jgi:hypothetical protein
MGEETKKSEKEGTMGEPLTGKTVRRSERTAAAAANAAAVAERLAAVAGDSDAANAAAAATGKVAAAATASAVTSAVAADKYASFDTDSELVLSCGTRRAIGLAVTPIRS